MGSRRRILAGTLMVLAVLLWAVNGPAAQTSSTKPSLDSKNIGTNVNPPGVSALPDLIIENIRIIPENPELGKIMTLQFSVKNIGAASASPAQVIIYGLAELSEIFKPDTDSTTQLAPGQNQVFSRSGLLNTQKYKILTGVHYFNVRIERSITESNYNNNFGSKVFDIYPPGGVTKPLPDITISAFSINPANPVSGAPAITTVTFINNGPGIAPATQVYFAAIDNEVLKAFGLPQPMKAYFTVPSLNPGQSKTFNYQTPNGKLDLKPGSYFLDVRANEPVGGYPETNAQNNTMRINFTVQSPVPPLMHPKEQGGPKPPNPK
jgi:hypothetical protein